MAKVSFSSQKKLSRQLLPQIQKLLKDNNVHLSALSAIKVNTGPGSFTGLRIGVASANALAFALKIPTNDLPVGETAVPEYGKEANITRPDPPEAD